MAAEQVLHMASFSLLKMAAGGMYDQLGGGFHRYSVGMPCMMLLLTHLPHVHARLQPRQLLHLAPPNTLVCDA